MEVAGAARKRRAMVEAARRRPTVVDLAAVGRKRWAATRVGREKMKQSRRGDKIY